MQQGFLSVEGTFVTRKTIEKSRFITTSAHTEGEEAARAFIDGVRRQYGDATHNCYAYICDDKGNFLRFSDDGEPQGTAGMPMLEVIKNLKLYQTAVVVTRYFGGIKLGAGGLVRAYSGCVAENLNAAPRVNIQPCIKSLYTVDYPLADALLRFAAENDCSFASPEYSDKVSLTVSVKSHLAEEFNKNLINRLSGKVKITPLGEYLSPFKVK